MSSREFLVLLAMCVVWGFHFVVIKLAVAEAPPIAYAAVRMAIVALVLAPFLRWRGPQMGKVIAAGFCLGALNYAFMFTGITKASASSAAIALELYVPFATLLSVVFLQERIGWRRIGGIALAFAGVALIALGKTTGQPASQGLGIALVAVAAFSEAAGAVIVKKVVGFRPLELLAWFALVGFIALSILSAMFETGQRQAFADADRALLIGAVLYSALGASLFGHTAYYWLIQRLPVSMVAPSALLTTLIAVGFSVVLLRDPFGLRIIVGGAMTLIGVGIVIFRAGATAPRRSVIDPVASSLSMEKERSDR